MQRLSKHGKVKSFFCKWIWFFSLCYGASFLASLLLVWAGLGRPFSPAWLVAPTAITVVADWIENLVQLSQLRGFAEGGAASLKSGWIQLSSLATMTKLIFFFGTGLLIIVLVGCLAIKGPSRS